MMKVCSLGKRPDEEVIERARKRGMIKGYLIRKNSETGMPEYWAVIKCSIHGEHVLLDYKPEEVAKDEG